MKQRRLSNYMSLVLIWGALAGSTAALGDDSPEENRKTLCDALGRAARVATDPMGRRTIALDQKRALFTSADQWLTDALETWKKDQNLSAVIPAGSALFLRIIKFPDLPSRAESDPRFWSAIPLDLSSEWAPWTEQLGKGSRVEVYLEGRDRKLYLLITLKAVEISGVPGPKTREGDLQTPEGNFALLRPDLGSKYLIAIPVGYNPGKVRGQGSDIRIHGQGKSVGCVVLRDFDAALLATLVEGAIRSGSEARAEILPFDLERAPEFTREWLSKQTPETRATWQRQFTRNTDLRSDRDLSRFWARLARDQRALEVKFAPSLPQLGSWDEEKVCPKETPL